MKSSQDLAEEAIVAAARQVIAADESGEREEKDEAFMAIWQAVEAWSAACEPGEAW